MLNSDAGKKGKRLEAAFLCVFAIVCAFLFWKCPYGVVGYDESFYLTIPYRLVQGDALFVHEWHLSQMSSVLLYPFVSAFVALTGGTEGMYLAFRYLYTAIQAGVSLFLYYRLRNINRFGAAAAALGFLIYAPFGIMALSYNSMGILSLSLCVVIFLTARRTVAVQDIFAGLFLAAAVLCCPYLLLVYLYLTGAALFLRLRRGEKIWLRRWCRVTLGSAMAAAAFLAFVFSRVSLSQLFAAFPELFKDPEHVSRSFLSVAATYGYWQLHEIEPVSLLIGAVAVGVFVWARLSGKKENLPRWFSIGAVLAAAFMIPFATYRGYPNYMMYGINLFALYCLGLVKLPKCREIFWTVVVPGFIYSFCIHWSSNQNFFVITSAMSVSFLGSMLIVAVTAQEILKDCPVDSVGKKNLVAAALCCLMVVQLFGEFWLRYSLIAREPDTTQLTHTIALGPAKGTRTTEKWARFFDSNYHVISTDPSYQQANTVLFLTFDAWMYLLDNKEFGTFSGWLNQIDDDTSQRLEAYFSLNPEKWPDYAFVFADDAEAADRFLLPHGYTANPSEDYVVYTR